MITNSMAAVWGDLPRPHRLRIAGSLSYVALLSLSFVGPLVELILHALRHSLHSHIPLVPFIAAYLLYIHPKTRVTAYRTSIAGTLVGGTIGFGALAAGMVFGGRLSVNDYLAVMTFAYVGFTAAGGFLFLGSAWMAAAAFPISLLVFMIPLPDGAVSWLEMASAQASADVAALLFTMTGTPLLRDRMVFALPGIVLEVARECSGIRSSWVLLITSLVASRLFLASPWRRVVLITLIIPLGVLRNAVRILTIGLLCVHVGPQMIDSPIHRQGGPVFFALSLVPLFMLLWWLWRQEHQGILRG